MRCSPSISSCFGGNCFVLFSVEIYVHGSPHLCHADIKARWGWHGIFGRNALLGFWRNGKISTLFDVMILSTRQLIDSAHDALPPTALLRNQYPFFSLHLQSPAVIRSWVDSLWWDNIFLLLAKNMHRKLFYPIFLVSGIALSIRIEFSCNGAWPIFYWPISQWRPFVVRV